jgi:tRNA 2-thiocytidine biosynthesis protein TtcA
MSGRFLRRAEPDTIVQKLCVKAIREKNLIAEGDRILIAASGGKDSTVLAWALATVRPALKISYELAALHISTDFCAGSEKSTLSRRLAGWGIPFTDLFVPVIGRLKAGRKMNCYWCSTQRRTELLQFAVEHNFNKIALGHHLDDIIETFFMNLCAKGRLETMPIMLKYRKYPVTLIRPLACLEEQQIIACADRLNILKKACTCPFGLNSARRDFRRGIASLTDETGIDPGDAKRAILRALSAPEDRLIQ